MGIVAGGVGGTTPIDATRVTYVRTYGCNSFISAVYSWQRRADDVKKKLTNTCTLPRMARYNISCVKLK